MKKLIIIQIFLTVFLIYGCKSFKNDKEEKSCIAEQNSFDTVLDGKTISLNTISNKNGMEVSITNYGARVVSIHVPDKNGKPVDVVLGFNTIKNYLDSPDPYFGPCIGRVANRIAKGKFSIDGEEYNLAINNGPNHLHGGLKGLHNVVWDIDTVSNNNIILHYLSPHLEEGYPGNLNISLTYSISEDNELIIEYSATSDKKTPVNLSNHSYFNLSGNSSTTINKHILTISAGSYTPVDSTLIPLGIIEPVEGTPFDFRKAKAIGADLGLENKQIKYGAGYDHNFVLNKTYDDSLLIAARVYSPETGIQMEIYTTEPGIQFYGGNFFTGEITGRDGEKIGYRCGFCLEPQHFPDTPNQPNFNSIFIEPGELYHSTSKYVFSIVSN
ncbi:MAG: galactose mutarotase [Bacteroidales bacterium]|nr:galactose mutarotase [Bacteroidales bacterium]